MNGFIYFDNIKIPPCIAGDGAGGQPRNGYTTCDDAGNVLDE